MGHVCADMSSHGVVIAFDLKFPFKDRMLNESTQNIKTDNVNHTFVAGHGNMWKTVSRRCCDGTCEMRDALHVVPHAQPLAQHAIYGKVQ